MKPVLRPAQAAWLAEIGVDMHWLDIRRAGLPIPTSAAAVPSRRDEGDRRPEHVGDTGDHAQLDAADLATLSTAILACQRCARHQQRIRAVPGAGDPQRPQYLIIGEQPGIGDEIDGQPFQGDAGRLLEAMLAAVQLPQAASRYCTYVMKCRASGGHEPDAAEISACWPYLQREIALLRPHRILALGRVAMQAVLGPTTRFEAVRGTPQVYEPAGLAIPVWVTHQPASLLVRSSLKAEAWRDLLGLVQAVRADAPTQSVTG